MTLVSDSQGFTANGYCPVKARIKVNGAGHLDNIVDDTHNFYESEILRRVILQ